MKLLILITLLALASCSTSTVNKAERCKLPSHLFDDDCNYRGSRDRN